MRTQDYKSFSKRIQKLAHKKRFPLRAMFELTYRCNFRCIHCYLTNEQKDTKTEIELTTKQVLDILKQLKDTGTLYLGLTGGEIFLRKDILNIIEYSRKLGFEVILLTNGSLINEAIADRLKTLMLNKIDITVHAMNKHIFDKITKTNGSGNKVFNAIELLHKRNIPLGLKSCGLQANKDEIVKVNKFAKSLNAFHRFDGDLMPRLDRQKGPLEYSISSQDVYFLRKSCYPEMFTKYDKEGRLRKKVKLNRNLKKLFNCGAGQTDLTISPYGELNICIEINYPRYKILEGSLRDGWQKIKDFVDNLKPPKNWTCKTCDLVKYCSWCPAKGYLEDGDFSACGHSSREHAEFVKNLEKS